MKCYNIHKLKSKEGSLYKLDARDELSNASFQQIAIFRDIECVALQILESVTRDLITASKFSSRFAKFLNRRIYPQVLQSREVFKWLGEQVAASV